MLRSLAMTERTDPRPGGAGGDDLARWAAAIAAAPAGSAANEEALLYRALAPRVRLYGLKHLRDGARADDLVQQVLWTTLERLRSGAVHDPERIASFVLGTSRAMAIDLLRGERRRRDLTERFAAEFADRESPREPLDRDRLAGCLDALSEHARAVVTLTFYAERGAAEIAEELTVSPGNVRVLRHRALATLRRCMESPIREVPS